MYSTVHISQYVTVILKKQKTKGILFYLLILLLGIIHYASNIWGKNIF